MTSTGPDARILRCRKAFLGQIVERLGIHPSDFHPESRAIAASRQTAAPRLAAGVLLPLLFRESSHGGVPDGGGFAFQLIKRSLHVSQPGDLSCPGGMIHPFVDRLLRPFLLCGFLPIVTDRARAYATGRTPELRRLITLFLATALRESWEEIRLSPWRVRFLGPLPTHTLSRYPRTIFPLAGFVEKPGRLRPNREVEKIVEIPLASFFLPERVGYFTDLRPDPAGNGLLQPMQHPCLIHANPDGSQDILWGATLTICVQFLGIVMDYQPPDWTRGPVITRSPGAVHPPGISPS